MKDTTCEYSILAPNKLQDQLNIIQQKWLSKWRIRVNESKSSHVTFTNKKCTCSSVYINWKIVPNNNSVKYSDLHLNSILTWKVHISKKKNEINKKYKNMYWLIGRKSQLALKTKVMIYKAILKLIWLYGCQICGTASESNLSKIQRVQSKIIRGISYAPWSVA